MKTFRKSIFLGVLITALLISGLAYTDGEVPGPVPIPSDPWCEATEGYEQTIRIALDGEAFAIIGLCSTLPVPTPDPDLQAIYRIAEDFHRIGIGTAELRSISYYATLPEPLPAPSYLGEATQRRLLMIADRLADRINRAEERGVINSDDASLLLMYQGNLADLVSALPIPIP